MNIHTGRIINANKEKQMTKLEQKLIELGYEKQADKYVKYIAFGLDEGNLKIEILTGYERNSISTYWVKVNNKTYLQNEKDILDYTFNLQQAFNQLQNDLKELKEYD